MNFKSYTVGFYLTPDFEQVCLIKKAKPPWQAGLLNGVGGSFEKDEDAQICMVREFTEEVGADSANWIEFAKGTITCHQGPCIVHYMVNVGPLFTPKEDLIEQAAWYQVDQLWTYPIVPNLAWLLPMALLKFVAPSWSEVATFDLL